MNPSDIKGYAGKTDLEKVQIILGKLKDEIYNESGRLNVTGYYLNGFIKKSDNYRDALQELLEKNRHKPEFQDYMKYSFENIETDIRDGKYVDYFKTPNTIFIGLIADEDDPTKLLPRKDGRKIELRRPT
jgi:hypothetical protein